MAAELRATAPKFCRSAARRAARSSSPATAFITYLSTPPGDGAEGLTTQSATGRLRGDELSLFADIAPAQDYEVVALNARIGEDADAMIGNVEATGCSSFGLELRE